MSDSRNTKMDKRHECNLQTGPPPPPPARSWPSLTVEATCAHDDYKSVTKSTGTAQGFHSVLPVVLEPQSLSVKILSSKFTRSSSRP